MYKKQIAYLILVSLISISLNACTGSEKSAVPTSNITQNSPYYSVTTAFAGHEKNHYMDVDIRIPAITYTGTSSDLLFDTINEEIYSKLSDLISLAEKNAKSSYDTYLETAKNNIIRDRDNRLMNLEKKYEGIITESEKSIIKSTIEKLNEKSTNSDIVINFDNGANESNNIVENIDINSFSNTNTIIDPNLHNKNIIIVETTQNSEEINASNITSDEEDSRPHSDKPNFDGKRPDFPNEERPNSNGEMANLKNDKMHNFNKEKTTPSEAITFNKNNQKKSLDNKQVATNNEIIKTNLTLDDFYKEIDEINNTVIPSDRELTLDYTPTMILCNFDVKCLDEDFLSLFVELKEIKTAPTVQRFFYNIDLKKKEIIKIKDVLGDDYKNLCINNITKSIESFTEEEKSNLKPEYNIETYINDDTPFFINNNHIPVIELDKFTLLPSYLEFQIIN